MVSAPPDYKVIKESVGRQYLRVTTDLGRPQQPHLAQLFPPWAVEDRPHEEDAR